jgi:O-antigen biosynthesis protein
MVISLISKTGKRILPAHTKRRVWVKYFLLKTGLFTRFIEDSYQKWLKEVEPNSFSKTNEHKYQPLISILVPVFNTPDKYLLPLIESVKQQIYQNWELCLADGSTDVSRSSAIKGTSMGDKRIKYIKLKQNSGISTNTNHALEVARGEYVAFLDHDDLLSPYALNEVVTVLQGQPELDLIYTDEDLISDNGKNRFNPFFKPGWSPDLLWAYNYITHFVVARRKLVLGLGGLRQKYDGAQDYDFLLRITEKTKNIYHIPKILYHWRMADTSTAKHGINNKSTATSAGENALADALSRRNLTGKVEVDENRLGQYQTIFRTKHQPKVVLAIPEPYDLHKTGLFLNEFLRITDYQNLEIAFNQIPSGFNGDINILHTGDSGNDYWQNLLKLTKADIVLGLQNAYIPLNPDWLKELTAVLQQIHVGAATGLVTSQDNIVVDFGLFKINNMFKPAFEGINQVQPTLNGFINLPRNFSALSGGVFVVQKQTLAQNLREVHITENKIKTSFFYELHKLGLYNLGWPRAKFISTNMRLTPTDQYYNPNLVHDNHEINLVNYK